MRTPEEVAAGLVRAEAAAGRYRLYVGDRYFRTYSQKEGAESDVVIMRKRVAAAIAQDRRDGWAFALSDPPVSEGREAEIRESYAKAVRLSPALDDPAVRDLLALLDHAKATIAWMSHERDIQERIDAARREGERKGRERIETLRNALFEVREDYLYGGHFNVSIIDDALAEAVPEEAP